MHRNCDEDSGRSSCSAASFGLSPIIDHHEVDTRNVVKRRHPSHTQEASTNTELKVSLRPRSCIALLKSPDEKDPFPSCRVPKTNRNSVFNLFDTAPRRGGLSDAHSTIDIASSTHIEQPRIPHHTISLNTVPLVKDKQETLKSNFRRGKPVQRAASRLYKADNKGVKNGCTGPEFIVRASQPVKQIDLTLSAFADKKIITVVLLNGQRNEVICDTNTITAGQLFEALVYSEKYEHNFMLGIAVLLGGDFVFLPDDYKMKKIAPENWNTKTGNKKSKVYEEHLPFTVFLRIKFFLPTNIARNIQGGDWRHRVYLQLRRSTVEGQLTSTLQNLILLAGYALHIEFGEYFYREHGSADYFLLEHYLPENLLTNDMSDIKLRMKRAHESRRGLDRDRAIINYISLAQTFRDYGAHFYSAVWATRDGFCRDVWLSIGPRGVTLYSRHNHASDDSWTNINRIVLQSLPWHHIHTFYYNKKNLYIMPNSMSLSKMGVKYKLKMPDGKSYFAFWLASLHHRLYLKLYAKEDFINYLSDELSCPVNKDGSPKKTDCSNYHDSYNLAVRNQPRVRKPVKRRFRVDIFSEKKVQNKENQKPNTEELLRQILSPQPSEESILNASPKSNTQRNSSNDGLSSSESCSLPRRRGVKMGTRVFTGVKSTLENKHHSASHLSSNTELRRFDDLTMTQSDSDDLGSSSEAKLQHCNVDSMKLLPERQYNQTLAQPQTAYVIESPKVYSDMFNYNATSTDSCLNGSIFEKLDSMGCVQGERVFVTAHLQRDPTNALGLQVAEGSDGNVYIKSITTGGPADLCKKLLPGDQIISVNGQTLLNMKYEKALSMLQNAPQTVELIVLQNTKTLTTEFKDLMRSYDEPHHMSLSNHKSLRHSVASGLEDIELTDDELLNEEALKTIYALIKLTKEKVISRMKDKEIRRNSTTNILQKCYSENKVYVESDMAEFSSQENTPQKKEVQKFHTWRGLQNHRPKRRPLSLSIPSDVDFINEGLTTGELMKKSSLKSIQSSLNSLDNKSIKSNSSKNVALPRNYGLSRKWLGPVRYPVTPCKNGNIETESAINNDVVKKHFVYGAGDLGEEQIFL